MYTDPSGEFIIEAILIGAFINTYIQGVTGKINSGKDFFLAMGIGAISGLAGGGVGQAVAGAVGTIGIAGGAITGASGGFAGGFVGGAGNAWAGGDKFTDGLISGVKAGGYAALTGGILGGISGGIRAAELDRNILTGAKKQPITFHINKDGTGSLISGYNYDRKNTSDFVKEYYKTPLDSHPSVSINSNGQVNIKLPKNIDGIDAVRAFNDKGKLMNVENLNPGRKFITFNTPFGKPDYFILHGFRYHSNPVRSFGDLFHSKSGNIRYP